MMGNRKEIGSKIREARENHGWSLEDLHRMTKIRIDILRNIEDGVEHELPDTYYRAFVRALADALDLNTESLFQAGMKEDFVPASAGPMRSVHTLPWGQQWQSLRKQVLVGAGSLFLVVIGLIYILYARRVFEEPPVPHVEVQEDSRGFLKADSLSDAFLLRAVAVKQGWLGVRVDSGHVQNVFLEKGQKHEWWINRNVILHLDNGRAVLLYLNGTPMEWTPEDSGQGMQLVITADGLRSQSVREQEPVRATGQNMDSSRTQDLVGLIKEEELFERFPVFSENREQYQPNSVILSRIEAINPNVRIICFLGTWDDLSREVIPGLLRIIQMSYLPDVTVNLIGLNRKLKDRAGLADYHRVQGIPTILFYFRGHELGRIVGRPTSRIEIRFLEIAQRTEKIKANEKSVEIDSLHQDGGNRK